MGMAASQARFLGLTARKTNTEYEGQQINQQRTTLSNQSANYYNQLLGMSVPVPPSVADYTKTVYTFTDGALNNSISSMIAQIDGTYLISYTSSYVNDFAVVAANSTIFTKKEEGNDTTYYVGSKELRPLTQINEAEYSYKVTLDNDSTVNAKFDGTEYYTEKVNEKGETERIVYTPKTGTTPSKFYDGQDEYLRTLSVDQINQLVKEEKDYIAQLNQKYGQGDWLVRYVQNTSTKTWSPYFTKKEVLDNAVYNDTGSSQSYIQNYTIGSAQETEEIKGITARFEQDATGRLISVTLKPGEDDQVTYAVTTNTLTDQAKYDDAMNQYEYDKYQYDQSIQEINSKIEIIQSEDKNLELRLKQLDTEQAAIQTEMDAVQKVIEKNTESTFKTFG